jgi:hypothetical protein
VAAVSPRCGEAGARSLERAPGLEQFGDVDRVDVQEDAHRLAEVALDGGRVEPVDERAAATSLDGRDQAELGERAQRLANRGAADVEPARLLEL